MAAETGVDDLAVDRSACRGKGHGRGVVETAFELLDHVAVLEPVRLIDLAQAAGIPRPSVHRLLQQLIAAGAVRRDGARYRLGGSLLSLGGRVSPERRLRLVARRPMAELAAATGAAVCLSATLGNDPVFLDSVDARVPLPYVAEPGDRVPGGTAQARAHKEVGRGTPLVDAGGVVANLSCVAVAVQLGAGDAAVVCSVLPVPYPPTGLLSATRATAARIAGLVRSP